MGLNIKNPEVEQLINQVAMELGISKTEAVRQAMKDKIQLLGISDKADRSRRLHELLDDLHAKNPQLKNARITKEEYDALYDYL